MTTKEIYTLLDTVSNLFNFYIYTYEYVSICIYELGYEQALKETSYAYSTFEMYSKKGYKPKTFEYYLMMKKEYLKSEIQKQEIEKQYCSYILSCRTLDNEKIAVKVGYSANLEQRILDLEIKNKKYHDYEIEKVFYFDNCEDGYEMEIWLHRYCKMIGGLLIGQDKDHFQNISFSELDINLLEQKAKDIQKNAKEWLNSLI